MRASGNIDWARELYPNLPLDILVEYVERLAAYRPKTMWASEKPNFDPSQGSWCFPFIDIQDSDNFDWLDYECWQELVEEELQAKHSISSLKFVTA